MNREHHAEEIFGEALELSAARRDDFIREACGEDSALLKEVQSLLDSHSRAQGFLQGHALGAAARVVDGEDPMLGVRVGAFRIETAIGRGGMGRVYLARREGSDFEQQAAIKIIRRGLGDEALRRFRNECQVLAMLEHPNIARMIDGGFTEDGTPFIIMEYVDGLPIDRYCDEHSLGLNERLDLFRTVCAATHHAHMHSTIHRDLKPSNILVDRSGTVKLVDFGIARVLDVAEGDQTTTAQQMLTPLYASPEQIRGEVLSTASDVYSLGVVLHKLLTGKLPFEPESASAQEMLRLHESRSPSRPSDLLATTDARDHAARRRRVRELQGDLDTIVLMAMRHEPERRYASAEQFSEDLHRHLRGLPVIAQPDTFGYRTRKFVRRNVFAVGAGTIVFITLMASTLLGFSLYRRAAQERVAAESARDDARENEATADAVAHFMTELFDEANPDKLEGAAHTARDVVDRGAARVREELADEPAMQARMMKALGDVYIKLGVPDSARVFLQEAVRIEREIHSPTHRSLASALRAYGDLLATTGDQDEALDMHLEALAMMERLYGEDAPELPPFMNRIALSHPTMPYDEKIRMFRRSLAIIEQAHGPDDPLVAYYLVNLAGALRRAGQYEEARSILERSLAIRERALGSDHPLVAVTLGSLGSTLNGLGEYEDALPLCLRSLEIRETAYGPEHLYVSMALNSAAGSYMGLGRHEEARAFYRRSIRIKELIYGEDHPYIGFDESDLALSYIRGGEPDAADPHLERALRILTRAYGESHHELGHPLTAMGEADAARGRNEAAVEHFTRALELREVLGHEHPLYRETQRRLAAAREDLQPRDLR